MQVTRGGSSLLGILHTSHTFPYCISRACSSHAWHQARCAVWRQWLHSRSQVCEDLYGSPCKDFEGSVSELAIPRVVSIAYGTTTSALGHLALSLILSHIQTQYL